MDHLTTISCEVRREVLQMSHRARTPHLGSALSCVDILTALYWGWEIDPARHDDHARDRVILSKGHAATALYAVLARRGFISSEMLTGYNCPESPLGEHPIPNSVPGVEAGTGSLGHGLSLGAGVAAAARLRGDRSRIAVVLSDGECNEGSVWEAAMFAAAQRLERLVAVVDYNKWQATGRSDEVLELSPLRDKWQAFGWSAQEVDGHNLSELTAAVKAVPDGSGRPVAIIAHTVKGKGVSFMEDDNNWHYRIPDQDELATALAELATS